MKNRNLLFKKKNFFLLFFVFFFCIKTVVPQGHDRFVSVLIIDKTASMTGVGDGKGIDIWGDVMDFLLEYIDDIELNTHLVIYTFDADLYGPNEFTIQSQADKDAVKSFIKNIKPDGMNTAIYKALDKVFDYINEKFKNNAKLVYMVTDGRDNRSQISFSDALQKFSANKHESDHIYYIDLRNRAPQNVVNEINNNDDITLTDDFLIPVTIEVLFKNIPYVMGMGAMKQRFIIHGGKLSENFTFNSKLDIAPDMNVNIDLNPSQNISKKHLITLPDGKLEYAFNLELLAGEIQKPEKINVHLEAMNTQGRLYNFKPSYFTIELMLREPPKVKAPKGGWR